MHHLVPRAEDGAAVGDFPLFRGGRVQLLLQKDVQLLDPRAGFPAGGQHLNIPHRIAGFEERRQPPGAQAHDGPRRVLGGELALKEKVAVPAVQDGVFPAVDPVGV